jgi:hypothetical protein
LSTQPSGDLESPQGGKGNPGKIHCEKLSHKKGF